MEGKTVSHYRILEKIGEGGMGQVYLAEDTSLKRKVALKFLPDYLQQDEVAQKRFLREAQSAAALDHPFICHIHEVGEADGKNFIAMEYVKGQTLKEKLLEGPVPLRQTLQIGMEIAEALEEAHKAGIAHRDLKPANIMLTSGGHVKVMDFGLAKKVIDQEGTERDITSALTREGTTLGTLAYMSPEQLRGKTLDTRSDIFSFGIVLYELLSGVHPFRKPKQVETTGAILHEDPPPVSDYTERTGDLVQPTLEKMLAKDVSERYQSVHEVQTCLLEAHIQIDKRARIFPKATWQTVLIFLSIAATALLAWWFSRERLPGDTPGSINAIAVLPLSNFVNDPEQEYFVAGMHEALITDLSKIGALKVISRTSVMRFKEASLSMSEIGEELGVDAVVEGSVFLVGNRVRITAQLIETATDSHLWAEKYDRELQDVLALHSEVAQAIAQEIQVVVTPQELDLLTVTRPVDPEAHQAYLRGRNEWGYGSVEKGIEYLKQAIEKDPAYALAYGALAEAYVLANIKGVMSAEDAYPQAKEAALKALELDPNVAEAHVGLAEASFHYEWDWEAADRQLRRALELNPGYATAHWRQAGHLVAMGNFEEATSETRRAQELEPPGHWGAMMNYYRARYYDLAIEEAQQLVGKDPDDLWARRQIGKYLIQKGMFEEGLAEIEKACVGPEIGPEAGIELAWAYAKCDKEDQARNLLREVLDSVQYISPFRVANVYAALGAVDNAFDELDRAHDLQDGNLVWVGVDPALDPLRSDPRFEQLLRKLNLPEEAIQRHLALPGGMEWSSEFMPPS